MAKLSLYGGDTDVKIPVFIQDSSSTTGAGLTGLAYDTASLVCYYVRPGSAAAQLALATQTVTGAHADGGFVEIDSTNMPGWYRLDLSDAVVATGITSVGIILKGAANMAPCNIEIQLDAVPADVRQIEGSANVLSGVTLSNMFKYMACIAAGKYARSGNVITVYDWDNTTALFTLTWAATGRTRTMS